MSGAGGTLRVIRGDGSPAAAARLTDALAAALDGSGPTVLPLGPAPGRRPPNLTRPLDSPTAVVIATSGSTGAPKGVLLSAAALRASAAATRLRLGGAGRWLLALPTSHVAGVQVIVRSLLAGTRPAVLDCRSGFRPERFDTSGCRYTALVPTQLRRLLDAGCAALRDLDAVLVGGAATAPALLAQARAAGVRVVTTYGMSETAGGCVYDGLPLEGVRVRLDPRGHVELAGPTLAHGYLGDPAASARAFADGWFRTGDVGRLDVHGRLHVLGRADGVIVSGGEKVAPARVEAVLLAQPGVHDACVVGLPDSEWGEVVGAAVVAPGGDPNALSARLRRAVRSALGAPAVPRRLRMVPALPLRGIGKPDLDAVRELLG